MDTNCEWLDGRDYLTLIKLNLFVSIFLNLKLELLKQYPASNDENISIYRQYTPSKFNYLINWTSTTNYITHFSDMLFGLKFALNLIYTGLAGQGLSGLNCYQQ